MRHHGPVNEELRGPDHGPDPWDEDIGIIDEDDAEAADSDPAVRRSASIARQNRLAGLGAALLVVVLALGAGIAIGRASTPSSPATQGPAAAASGSAPASPGAAAPGSAPSSAIETLPSTGPLTTRVLPAAITLPVT